MKSELVFPVTVCERKLQGNMFFFVLWTDTFSVGQELRPTTAEMVQGRHWKMDLQSIVSLAM